MGMDALGRLSEMSRQILALAKKEAAFFQHDQIRTEHILLAIAAVPEAVAGRGRSREAREGREGEGKPSLLTQFGRDLTQLARVGRMDPLVGRQKELTRIAQILLRRTKNNPVLVGEAGVGKTAIVEG